MNACGALRLTADGLRKMLRSNGVRASEKLWRNELEPLFAQTLWRLDVAHDEAAHALSRALRREVLQKI
ncbi:hypothetical protein BZG04_15760 [Salinivibrio kushneri]|nr:hypothetical protein BZG04_15760 [Salinivibrio kushneri]